MNIIKKYPINYYQSGGKPYDYFFYRLLNSFIEDKKEILELINSFPNGINLENISELKLKINNPEINQKLDNLLKLYQESSKSYPLITSRSYIQSFDKYYFETKESFLTTLELQNKIEVIPNIITNFIDYIQYILNHRKKNYFESDRRRYIKDYAESILEKKYDKIFIDKIKISKKIQNY